MLSLESHGHCVGIPVLCWNSTSLGPGRAWLCLFPLWDAPNTLGMLLSLGTAPAQPPQGSAPLWALCMVTAMNQ